MPSYCPSVHGLHGEFNDLQKNRGMYTHLTFEMWEVTIFNGKIFDMMHYSYDNDVYIPSISSAV